MRRKSYTMRLCQTANIRLNRAKTLWWDETLSSTHWGFISRVACLGVCSWARKFHLYKVPRGDSNTHLEEASSSCRSYFCGVFHAVGVMMMTTEPVLGLGIQFVQPRPWWCLWLLNRSTRTALTHESNLVILQMGRLRLHTGRDLLKALVFLQPRVSPSMIPTGAYLGSWVSCVGRGELLRRDQF